MRSIIFLLLMVYILVGIICWIVGVRSFGGRKRYMDYLKQEMGMGSGSYYLCLVIFILTWPLFLSDQ